MRKALLVLALGAAALMANAGAGVAAEPARAKATTATEGALQPAKGRYSKKRAVRVRGYVARRGGYYSYQSEDVINTYGLTRSLYGSINSYRDPYVDRQSTAGPFDSGFFFDSGMAPRGGDGPYLH